MGKKASEANPIVTEPKTSWSSIYVSSALSFVGAVQFSLYFSSMWQYLKIVRGFAAKRIFINICGLNLKLILLVFLSKFEFVLIYSFQNFCSFLWFWFRSIQQQLNSSTATL